MINQIQFLIWLKALGFRRNIVYLLWLNPCCRVWLVGVKGKQKYCWDSDAYLGQSIKKCFLELYHLLFVYISLCWSPFRSETPAAVIIKRFRITLCVICHWSHTNSEVCLAYSRNCGDSLQFTLLTLGCERPQFLIRHLGIWPFRLWVCFFFCVWFSFLMSTFGHHLGQMVSCQPFICTSLFVACLLLLNSQRPCHLLQLTVTVVTVINMFTDCWEFVHVMEE